MSEFEPKPNFEPTREAVPFHNHDGMNSSLVHGPIIFEEGTANTAPSFVPNNYFKQLVLKDDGAQRRLWAYNNGLWLGFTPSEVSGAISGVSGLTDTGWKYPTATGTPNNQWTDPTEAYLADYTYATHTDIGTPATYWQSYGDFGFDGVIPAALISGIEVSLTYYCTGSGDIAQILLWDGVDQVFKSVTAKSVLTTVVYGSSVDIWGGDWVVADFNDANFYLAFSHHCIGTSSVAYVDEVKAKVYYIPT